MRVRAARRGERGSSAVEFALIVVLFFTLLFGMIQYSLYFWSTQAAANAAREGARRGAVGQTCPDLQSQTTGQITLHDTTPVAARKYVNPSTGADTAAATGANVKVTITFNSIDLHFPFVPFINNGSVTETAVARVENYNTLTPGNWTVC
jgi:Flp pilus assembly protein TadG